jgi:MFS family permease
VDDATAGGQSVADRRPAAILFSSVHPMRASIVIAQTLSDETAEAGGKGRTGAHKWYVLGILALIYIMGSVDRAVVSVVAEPLKAEFGLSDKQIGILGGMAYSATYAIAVLPMGWLVDRINRKRLLSATVLIWSLLTSICAVATSYTALVIARMGVGVAEAPASPASLSLIADIFPLSLRNTAVSIYYAGTAAGQIVIFVIGGWLLLHFDWRTVFLVAGGPGILLAGLLLFTTREPKRGAFDPERKRRQEASSELRRPRVVDTIRGILGNPALCFAIPGITIAAGVNYSLTVWTTSFLVRVHGLSVSEGAIWTGVGFGMFMTAGALMVGPIADRFSRGNQARLALIPMVTTIVATAAGVVLALGQTLFISLAGLAVAAFMCGFFSGTGYSIILSLASAEERGTTLGATKLLSIFAGSGLVPLVTGAISDAIGGSESIRPALLITVLLLSGSTFCYAMVRRVLLKTAIDIHQ